MSLKISIVLYNYTFKTPVDSQLLCCFNPQKGNRYHNSYNCCLAMKSFGAESEVCQVIIIYTYKVQLHCNPIAVYMLMDLHLYLPLIMRVEVAILQPKLMSGKKY